MTLLDLTAATVISYAYGSEGGNDQSVTRDPDITGPDPLVLHSTATGSGGALFSPGTMISGAAFAGCPFVVVNDLSIAKTGPPSVVAAVDEILVYTITLVNQSVVTATNVSRH